MKFRQTNHLSNANFQNNSVIFNLKNYRFYILNETAYLIWDFCKAPKDLNQISGLINNKYKVDLNKALKDAKKLTNQLRERNLLC